MASDVVRMICPNLKCRTLLSVPSEARGKTVRCRQCGARVRIPDARPNEAERSGGPTSDESAANSAASA